MNCPNCKSDKYIVKAGFSDNRKHQRFKCTSCKKNFTDNTHKSDKEKVKFNNKLDKSSKYVITAAQNATPIHEGFFKSLLVFCEHNDAQLVVVPYRYKNPTSLWSKNQEHDEWWDDATVPYLYSKRKMLGKNLELIGDIKTQPTATSPLSGLDTISKGLSAIVGHSKIQLKVIPSLQKQLPNILTTTGACTLPNYSDTKAGKKGEFHHAIAACFAEVKGNKFELRQLNALKDGSFIDMDKEYTVDRVKAAPRAAALVLGDTHERFKSPKVDAATFGKDGLVERLEPEQIIWHDLLDGYSRSHHHKKDPFTNFAKHVSKKEDYREEVTEALAYVSKCTPKNTKSFVVRSNHHDHLMKWIKETDWRHDPINAEFYLETALHLIKNSKVGTSGANIPDPFELWFDRLVKSKNVSYISQDCSHIVEGIECGLHGDQGFNGSRGSLNQFKKLGTKTITGHSHTPGIEEGAYAVGTSSVLDLEYAKGASSWVHCHCVLYANGKRSLLFIL